MQSILFDVLSHVEIRVDDVDNYTILIKDFSPSFLFVPCISCKNLHHLFLLFVIIALK